jgi:hypothetical protein
VTVSRYQARFKARLRGEPIKSRLLAHGGKPPESPPWWCFPRSVADVERDLNDFAERQRIAAYKRAERAAVNEALGLTGEICASQGF